MIQRDGIEKWKDLLEPMINWMNSEQINSIPSGLDTFCVIIETCDDRVHALFPKLIQTLYKMYTRAEVSIL